MYACWRDYVSVYLCMVYVYMYTDMFVCLLVCLNSLRKGFLESGHVPEMHRFSPRPVQVLLSKTFSDDLGLLSGLRRVYVWVMEFLIL